MMKKAGRRFILCDYLQNKKIVIYGAGDTGKTLYSQLLDKGIDVVAVVDQNADFLENTFFCPLHKPEIFFNSHLLFDFIFVANASVVAKKEIKEYLIENGIGEKSILYLEENFYDGIREYQMKDDPEEALHQLIQANENIKGDVSLTKQFHIWMNVYYNNLTDKEEFKNKVKYEFHNNSSNEVRIMLGLYLFELKELDAVEFRKFVEYVSKLSTDQYDWMYFLTVRIYHMEFVQNMLIKGLGAERRALWKRILEHYGLYDMLKSYTVRRTEGKIAILVYNLRGPDNALALIYRMMANNLVHIGRQVKIFVISALAGKKSFGFLSLQDGLTEQELSAWDGYNRKMLDKAVEIEYISENNILGLLSKAVNKILEFCPQHIIDGLNQINPVSGILYKYFPVIYYSVAASTSGTFFTKTTANVFEYNEEIIPYHITLPYSFIEKSEPVSYNKSERLGIPEESFVIVTVGNRLYAEIDEKLINRVIEILQEHEKMYWILVGNIGGIKSADNIEKMGNRVKFISYEENLSALYKLCDVFLNPDRIGGGFSMMFAMQQKVVVAGLKKNIFGGDGGVTWVGEDELIEGHYKELCEYIVKLYESPKLLKEKKEKMWEIIHEKCSTERWVTALCDALDSTEQAFLRGENNGA